MKKVNMSQPVYVIKGKVTDHGNYIKMPHTPAFGSAEDAKEYYEQNKSYQSYYRWNDFKDLSIFKMPPRPADVFVESIESVIQKEH